MGLRAGCWERGLAGTAGGNAMCVTDPAPARGCALKFSPIGERK